MATYTWVGGADIDAPNNWITPANWVVGSAPATAFPNGAGDVAIVNVDDGTRDAIISGGQSITVANLNIGGTTNGSVQGGHVIVGGGPAIGGGGTGTLISQGVIAVTSTNSGGGIVGGPNSSIVAPGMGLSGPGVIVGGGGAFNIGTIVNNGTIQADGANFNLGPLVLNSSTISGTGVIEVDNNSVVEINAPTNNNVQVSVLPGQRAAVVFDQPGSFTGAIDLLTPNTSVDLYFKGQTPTSVTFDPSGRLVIGGANGVLDNIPFVSNGTVALKVVPSTLTGYGEVHLGPEIVPNIPAPVNGVSTTTLSSADLSRLLQGDQSAFRFISGTEAVQTVDGTLSVGQDTNQAYLIRLYEGLLGRSPDQNGLSAWDATLSGSSKAAVAQTFVESGEFQAAHGNEDNATFVNTLYQGMLGRSADQGGLQAWTQALASGTSRGELAATFADSPEAKAHWAGVTSNGRFAFSQAAELVRQDYQAAFGRDADTGGLTTWTNAVKNGLTPSQLAQSFAASGEFQALHGQQSDAQYVDSLYVNALGRNADAEGQAAWVKALQSGTSRADLLQTFAQSSEAQQHLTWALS